MKYTCIERFIAQRIVDGLDYTEVVIKRPDLKQVIDCYLGEIGRADLIKITAAQAAEIKGGV